MKRIKVEDISRIYSLAEGLNPGDKEYKVRALAEYLKNFPLEDGLGLRKLGRALNEMGVELSASQREIALEIFDYTDYTKENFLMLIEVYNELESKGQEGNIKAYRDYFNELRYFRGSEGRDSIDVVLEELSDLASYAHENEVEFCDGVAKTLHEISCGNYSKESIITQKVNVNVRFLNDQIVKLIESEDTFQLVEIYYLLMETKDALDLKKEILSDVSLRNKSIPNRRYELEIESLDKLVLTLDSSIARCNFALNRVQEDEEAEVEPAREDDGIDKEARVENIKARMHNIWNNLTYKYHVPLKNQGLQHVYDNNPFVKNRLFPALKKLDQELIQLTGESLFEELIQDLKDGHINRSVKRPSSAMGEDE